MITLKVLVYLILFSALVSVAARYYLLSATRSQIVTEGETDSKPAAVVFGAGLRRDGSPTAILRDRVETAVRLYKDGKVQKILMSGDNRFLEYNEPGSMKEYAISLGVPEQDIVLDYAGRRTYDSCYRAKAIFGLESALLVTQEFHLPRAIYTCTNLGMDVNGIPATGRSYRQSSILFWNLREVPATIVSLWENHISHPIPVLGDPEPIFPNQS
jgi:vancomycin permeability regulator SanA